MIGWRSFLYGTAWKEDRTEELTSLAVSAGFMGIDTANQRKHYFEAGVGNAVAAFLDRQELSRQDVFLQTKFTHARGQDHRIPYDVRADPATQVQQSFQSSLEHLRITYVDSYLLHGPSARVGLTDTDWAVWSAIEQLHKDGKTRHIGVSNVSLGQLELLCASARVQPAFVQNRCYADARWDRNVRRFCTANGIQYQAFSLLTANTRELRHPVVARIAERTGGTVAQIVFRFAQQVGMIPLTGTTSVAHMTEDLACSELELFDDEIEALEMIAG